MRLALALEQKSEHPLARAILARAQADGLTADEVTDFRALSGSGLTAVRNGQTLCGGSLAYVSAAAEVSPAMRARCEALAEDGKTPLLFSENGRLLGVIAVADVVKPDSTAAIAALLRDGGQEVRGVLTHAGSAYDLPTTEAIAALAVQECAAANTAARLLREAGFSCPVVSVGSTPTAFFGEDFSGITEVRAGVYVFQDLVMAGLGVCRPEDLALSVLTTVIGRQSDGSALIIDAGWMALSRDTGLPWKREEFGYGLVCDEAGNLIPGLRVTETNQEHGIVSGPSCPALPAGSRLRILPIHACATAACFDSYTVLREGRISGRLERCRGW